MDLSKKKIKIAVLFTGRIHHYSTVLKNFLAPSEEYEYHLFCSINDDNDNYEFYNLFKKRAGPILKDFYCNPYILPKLFLKYPLLQYMPQNAGLYHGLERYVQIHVNVLSMLWNDANAFEMASAYANNNNFKYDIYLRTRTDLTLPGLPDFKIDDTKLFFAKRNPEFPLMISDKLDGENVDRWFHWPGNKKYHGVDCLDTHFVYGPKHLMRLYCFQYADLIRRYEKSKGHLMFLAEWQLTQFILENEIPHERFFLDHLLLPDYRYEYENIEW